MVLRPVTKEELNKKLIDFYDAPGNYAIICIPTKGIWIGTSGKILTRLRNHLNLLNRNGYIDHNSSFQKDWNNYGITNLFIVACYYDEDRTNDEASIQKLYKEKGYTMYNISIGTDNSLIKNLTPESRLKMSKSQKKRWNEKSELELKEWGHEKSLNKKEYWKQFSKEERTEKLKKAREAAAIKNKGNVPANSIPVKYDNMIFTSKRKCAEYLNISKDQLENLIKSGEVIILYDSKTCY